MQLLVQWALFLEFRRPWTAITPSNFSMAARAQRPEHLSEFLGLPYFAASKPSCPDLCVFAVSVCVCVCPCVSQSVSQPVGQSVSQSLEL